MPGFRGRYYLRDGAGTTGQVVPARSPGFIKIFFFLAFFLFPFPFPFSFPLPFLPSPLRRLSVRKTQFAF